MGTKEKQDRGKNAPSVDAMKWMVTARGKILATLAELYEIHNDYMKDLESLEEDSQQRDFRDAQDNDLKPHTGIMCGIAFSLWRSAFLMYELGPDSRTPQEIVSHQRALLLQLARDNSATFGTEKETRFWMIGFHLNNARNRLLDLFNRIGRVNHQFGSMKPYDYRMSRTRNLSDEWDDIHSELKTLIQELVDNLKLSRNQ